MKAAVQQSGRRNFVWRCLFMLWPSAKQLLVELSRQLGDDICLPGDNRSLLCRSIIEGANAFYERHKKEKREYIAAEWDLKVYIMFFGTVFLRAAEVGDCRVTAVDGSCWTVDGLPYLDWRREHPGPVEIDWFLENDNYLEAEQLARLSLSACDGRRIWVNNVLLSTLARQLPLPEGNSL